MKASFMASLAVVMICLIASDAEAQVGPQLSIQWLSNQTVEVTWTNSPTPFLLEGSTAVFPAVSWQPISEPTAGADTVSSVTLEAVESTLFFRLRAADLTRLTQTSPVNGETGVSVTRETIFRFNYALASNTVLRTSNVFAEFGGRRYLSRVDLSSDRQTVTLFHLEPLPGSARIQVTFDAPGLTDQFGRLVDLDGDGVPGGGGQIEFETTSLTPLAGTGIVGTVFAAEQVPGTNATDFVNRPLAGVTITVDGMEQTLRTVTDTNGFFRLNPCPAGQFFVHIDGRTVTNVAAGIRYPDLAYYPFVGKAWSAVAGRTNNIAGFMPGSTNAASSNGWIFLPLITQGTLQPVNLTEDTTINFPASVIASNPALAGVTITVPANSLFSDDGTRGGKVGIAPVPPDRLPGPLPPGLEMPIVITVQTDGALNFDRPAPICFPNLPDPVLGVPLEPGSKQALVSFNHDKGVWEAVGSMTVSADGNFVCTDPGAGILQPGWHGVGPIPDGPPPCGEGLCCPDGEDGVSPLGGGARFASVGKAAPSPGGCKKPCKLKQLAACEQECVDDLRRCRQFAFAARGRCQNTLHSQLPVGCNTSQSLWWGEVCETSWELLDEQCLRRLDMILRACREDFGICRDRCREECPNALARSKSLANAGPAEDPIADEIVVRLEAIDALVLPYLRSGMAVPPEVVAQANTLHAEAVALASGDILQFLEQHIIAVEADQAASDAEFGEDPGNAPTYPVLFAAEIARPDGMLTLRGETGPFGQYSLFVPRDGVLQFVSFYDPHTKRFGSASAHLRPEAPYRMPRFNLHSVDETFADSDGDGLADAVEFVYGTDDRLADSDGDGIFDGAEIDQGTNPLDGLPVRTGIVGTARTPGAALDVWAGNDLVVTAEGTAGVSIFNAFQSLSPTLIAHVPMTGNAQRLAGDGNFLGVAAGDAGLTILDIRIPAEARILHELRVGLVEAVAARQGTFYAGLRSGLILAFDAASGLLINRAKLADPVRDLGVAGDTLYALTLNRLFAIPLNADSFAVANSLPTQGTAPNQRLFVGGGLAYSVHIQGYNTFSLAAPTQPLPLGVGTTAQLGWRQIVPNGAGLGLAVVGPNPSDSPAHDLYLHDVSDPRTNNLFLTLFATPGTARAVAILEGLAYVADDTAGLQIINYLAYDSGGVPPSISLQTSATGGGVAARSPLRLTADATDDVQVRSVEFYVDGQRASSDGNFPFEHWFVTPSPTETKTNLTLRARAIDTGGNATWSAELVLELEPDTTPPHVVAVTPEAGTRTLSQLRVLFSEAMSPASINPASFQLISAGPDGQLDTGDDGAVSGGVVGYDEASRTASIDFDAPVPDGLYRAVVTTSVMDLSGNHPASDFTWVLRVADAVFWVSRIDGFWENPSNWSTRAVPGPEDNVILDLAGQEVTVTLSSGDQRIKSLMAHERLTLTGGVLEVAGGIQLGQSLTLNGGTIRNSTVTVAGGGRLVCANNPNNFLDAVIVNGDLDVTSVLAQVRIRNGLTLTGTALLNNLGLLYFTGSQTFHSGGVSLAGDGQLGIEPGTTLTLGSNLVVRGRGTIGAGGFGTRRLINQGVISADGAGNTINIGSTYFENAGTFECQNGGAVSLPAGGTMRNTGVINASGGGTLTLSGSWTNLGTINATGATVDLGGTFRLADIGTFNRTGGAVNLTGVLLLDGGTLALNAATGSWAMRGGTLAGGTVTQTEGSKLLFTANAVNTLDGVRVEGDLMVSAAQVFIRNGLTLAGSALLDNLGVLYFAGSQTFDSAQVSLAGDAQLGIEPGTTLTLGPALVVRGRGTIGAGGFGTRRLINQGLIAADVAGGTIRIGSTYFENAGTFECQNGGAVSLPAGETMRNTGVINASSGGTLTLSGSWTNLGTINATGATVDLGGTFRLTNLGTFNRTGGAVNLTGVLLLDGGTLTLDAATGSWAMRGGTIAGGTVRQTEGSKLLFTANAVNTLDGVRVEGDLMVSAAQVFIRNGLTLAASALLDNLGVLYFTGSQTFDSAQVSLAGDAQIGIEPGTTLTLGPALVVRGRGTIGAGGFGTRRLINQGLIAADGAGNTINIGSTYFENAGTFECQNGGAVSLPAGGTMRNTGVINASGGGTLTLSGSWTNLGTINATGATVDLGGTFRLADIGTFNRTGGAVNLTGVLLLDGGTLTLDAATGSWAMRGGTLAGGTVRQTEGSKLLFTANAVNTLDGVSVDGDLVLTNTAARALIRNGLTLAGNVILANAGAITFAGNQTFNTGQIVFTGTSGALWMEPGTTLTLGPAMVVRGQTGNIGPSAFGTVTLINQGLISADVANGTLTVSPQTMLNDTTGILEATAPNATLRITSAQFTDNGTRRTSNGGQIIIGP